ncbi:MAG: indolepyruvate ferredoxin oxidoreductase family protein [Alphaproteobacteria bacterium]|nr:indolepyruvate ferredoxin oxidoreductase family protein [Alphaproteobacteria bacterium]
MSLKAVSLDDKYQSEQGQLYLTGSQALVRAAMMQYLRDKAAGLNTASFISGYRGSPMHNIDKELWRANRFLAGRAIHFVPGVNEDLAATACLGTQQSSMFGDSTHDGVFAMWYGKGPGLDRSIDAMRHNNLLGTSRHGGALAVVGDDHAMKSTDVPAASETMFADLQMPMLYPASVQEIVDYSLYGWAMSRFSGAWTGFKIVADTVDAAAPVDGDPHRLQIVMPEFEFPEDGVHIRTGDKWVLQEPRLRNFKLPAALAFARANNLNRVVMASARPRIGIITSGKASVDVRQALMELGINGAQAADLGIVVLKMAMPFPFDADLVSDFAAGLEEIVVVEEKRRFLETRVRDALYDLPDGQRPRVVGRHDGEGNEMLPGCGEFGAEEIARALAGRIEHFHCSEQITARLAFLDAKARRSAQRQDLSVARIPYFCSGCPHNTSTKVPEGSRGQAGVGCHYMASYMNRDTDAHTQMGAEGANWIGHYPFSKAGHVFQNIGDGTYFHSGLLAIRACIAAKVNITYKILFNDAVAMTGGQPIDGELTPMAISRQVHSEGVKKIVVVSDQPDKYPSGADFAPGVTFEHRRSLARVQRELREIEGVTVLIYDQTCAAEKRRRRKKGEMEDPARRVFVNHLVCEGCGDCSTTSNCMSVLPLQTEYGRKRRIDQSSCNKDYSCAEGFCPSFVSVIGGIPRKAGAVTEVPDKLRLLPEPTQPELAAGETYGIMITGIGGTGVVTISALLTMAAHMEGKAFSTIDQFGMAQKGGPVSSHVRLALHQDDIQSPRLSSGTADLLLGCDSLVTASELGLNAIDAERSHVLVNSHQAITGQFALDPNLAFPGDDVEVRIQAEAGPGRATFLNATRLATALLGDAIGANLFMLGHAYQQGLIPVSAEAIEQAIEMNGVALEMNKAAFLWGRRAAVDLDAVTAVTDGDGGGDSQDDDLAGLIARRQADLTAYQGKRLARRYGALVEQVRGGEAAVAPDSQMLTLAVAQNLYKLMAYKDEYEVARLYSDGRFGEALERQFEGEYSLVFHLAPPLWSKTNPDTGLPMKRDFKPWMATAMTWLARLKFLRGGPLDIFGKTEERRAERRLIGEYEAMIEEILSGLKTGNLDLAIRLASVPELITGFGHIKARHLEEAMALKHNLLAEWRDPGSTLPEAAE